MHTDSARTGPRIFRWMTLAVAGVVVFELVSGAAAMRERVGAAAAGLAVAPGLAPALSASDPSLPSAAAVFEGAPPKVEETSPTF